MTSIAQDHTSLKHEMMNAKVRILSRIFSNLVLTPNSIFVYFALLWELYSLGERESCQEYPTNMKDKTSFDASVCAVVARYVDGFDGSFGRNLVTS